VQGRYPAGGLRRTKDGVLPISLPFPIYLPLYGTREHKLYGRNEVRMQTEAHKVVTLSPEGPARLTRRSRPVGPRYKWVALTNTTLGVLMATIDSSIVLISLPVIFKGIGINPLAPD